MISPVESVQAIMNCYQTGIVIVPGAFWRNQAAVTEEVSNLLISTAHLTVFTTPHHETTIYWSLSGRISLM